MIGHKLPKEPLISSSILNELIRQPSLVIVEAVMKPVGAPENWETGFKIPNAVRFDINKDFSDPNTDLPHMMPNEEQFSKACGRIGISDTSLIVIYDQVGTYGSARAWWMFKAMGHKKVFVLHGGVRAWMSEGNKTVKSEWPDSIPCTYNAKRNKLIWKTKNDILEIYQNQEVIILDARSKDRFFAKAPEPRPGLRGGHIPGSYCLPFTEVMDGIYLKSKKELKDIFAKMILSNQQIITTCGSGVTAAILALAGETAGYHNIALYDGSWAEWGLPGETPVNS